MLVLTNLTDNLNEWMMNDMEIRTCIIFQKKFEARTWNQVTCSKECRIKSARERTKKCYNEKQYKYPKPQGRKAIIKTKDDACIEMAGYLVKRTISFYESKLKSYAKSDKKDKSLLIEIKEVEQSLLEPRFYYLTLGTIDFEELIKQKRFEYGVVI